MTVLWFNQLIITPVNCRLSGPFALGSFALAVRSDSYLDCHGGKDGTKQHIENIAAEKKNHKQECASLLQLYCYYIVQ
jgi:hypothetical protein